MGSPSKQDLARGHLHEPGDHLHGGGLARAVRAQVAGHLAGARRKADVVDGGDAVEPFGNVAKFEHGLVILCSNLQWLSSGTARQSDQMESFLLL